MRKVRGWSVPMLGILLLLLSACSTVSQPAAPAAPAAPSAPAPAPAPAKAPDPKQLIVMGGVGSSSVSDLLTLVLEKGLRKEFPNSLVRRIPGGILEAPGGLVNKDADFVIINSTNSYSAVKGVAPYKVATPDIRLLYAVGDVGTMDVVVLDNSGINSIEDLKDKRIGVGTKTSVAGVWMESALKAVGLDYAKIAANGGGVSYGAWNDQFDQMADGQLDAVVVSQFHPNQMILQVASKKKARLLPLGDKAIDAVLKEFPGTFRTTMKKGTYDFMAADHPTFAFVVGMYVHKDLPDDVAYRAVKVMFDPANLQELWYNTKEVWKNLDLRRDAALGVSIQLHPGAERYYKEQNIKIQSLDLK